MPVVVDKKTQHDGLINTIANVIDVDTQTKHTCSGNFVSGGMDGVIKVWTETNPISKSSSKSTANTISNNWHAVASLSPAITPKTNTNVNTNGEALSPPPPPTPSDNNSNPPILPAITSLAAISFTPPNTNQQMTIIACSRATCKDGAVMLYLQTSPDKPFMLHASTLHNTIIETVALTYLKKSNTVLVAAGAAAPRNNKVHILSLVLPTNGGDMNPSTFQKLVNNGGLIGHQDWIRCLSFSSQVCESGTTDGIILASGSHDHKIRLWLLSEVAFNDNTLASTTTTTDDFNNDDDDEPEVGNAEIDVDAILSDQARLTISDCNGYKIPITLEAMLVGHEDSVSSVAWHPTSSKPCLLSSSMDRTLLIWTADETSNGIWMPMVRVGASGGIVGGSLGSSLIGFVGAVWGGDNGNEIIGHGYGGSIQLWRSTTTRKQNDEEVPLKDLLAGQWETQPGIGGHFGAAVDCCWEPTSGRYLLSTSSDQTTRMWGRIDTCMEPDSIEKDDEIWVEVGRPQVHGYDLTACVCVGTGVRDGGEPTHRFVSGADEKQLRVFDAPGATLKLLKQLRIQGTGNAEDEEEEFAAVTVERAYLPCLGLSNKGGDEAGNPDAELDIDVAEGEIQASSEIRLPLERDLGIVTLWPEVRKMYGHGAEVLSLASTAQCPRRNKGEKIIVASASKARDVDGADIKLWDIESSVSVGMLEGGHKSSVAALSFSSDASMLASSGKDRRICIWKRSNGANFTLAAAEDNAHKRIVWCLAWSTTADDVLVSGARDGLLKVWNVGSALTCVREFSFGLPVTSVAFAPGLSLAAIGLESGVIKLWDISEGAGEGRDLEGTHVATVERVCWRPKGEASGDTYYLASCGLDHAVKVHKIKL